MKEPIEVLILRCGDKYQEADQDIKTRVNHIILWELYQYQKYPEYKSKKRKRRRKN